MNTTKEQFAQQLQSIIRLHRRGAGGVRVALALTERLDSLIQSAYTSLPHSDKKLLAIVSLGGYGRRELCFSSDTDIMFLVQSEGQKQDASPIAQDMLHHLLDYGLTVGHSFRTIQECLELAGSDPETWNSLLESRFICGGRATKSSFRAALKKQIGVSDKSAFVRQLINTAEMRHQKYGHSAKLLEPNIKNSAGGLRGLHNVLWLMRGTDLFPLPAVDQKKETACSALLRSPLMSKRFSQRFLHDVEKGLDFLLRCRNEMHLQAGALHDTLEFNLQRQVAEALHYRATPTRTSVERFMQDYYVAARSIAQLAQRTRNWAEDHFVASSSKEAARPLTSVFVLQDKKIDLRHAAKRLSSEDALQAFLLAIEQDASFSHRLDDLLSRSTASYAPLRTEREALFFRELLNKDCGVSQAIHKMNDLGLLARWFPEWRGLVAFFQHNQYHFYTADEHTLMVLANAEALAENRNTFGQVFQSLPRRDTLYLAALLHDIAKPKRIGDHEIIGVDIARAVLKRLRYTDVMEDVLFLVRHHLLMEQVAFRRNLSDPQTVIDFAGKIKNTHQLDLLYLLTYADLNAVNKNVWTDWKAMLLFELYRRAHQVLEGELTSAEVKQPEAVRHEAAVRELVNQLASALPEEQTRGHLDAVESPDYLATFDVQEIAEHIRRIGTDETVSAIFKRKEDHTEVTVIARDAPFALSRFCGVLSANDANIFDARIFTRNDGMIIDRFRVIDFISKTALNGEQCHKIHQELNDVFNGKADIEQLLQRHRMKWKRRRKTLNPNIRIDVEFEDHPRFTIIDVYAPDMLGFLYRITGTMSLLGLNISFAKIATRVDGIVDSFYVLDLTGKKLEETGQQSYVKSEILKVINDLTESELVMQ